MSEEWRKHLADMNKIESTKQVRCTVWNFNTGMFITLTQVPNVAKTTIKLIKNVSFVFEKIRVYAFHTLFHD